MFRVQLAISFILLTSAILGAQPGQDVPPDQQARMRAMVTVRHLAQAVIMYSHEHNAMPGDVRAFFDAGILTDTLGQASEDGSALVADGVRYGYLGLAGVSPSEVPDWGDIAIGHLDFEQAFATQPTPDNPDGALVSVAFLDGHVEMVSLAEARWLVEESSKTLSAIRDGAPLPQYRQVEQDAARLARAMRAYAAEHDGLAPPDWASTYPYLEADEGAQDASDQFKIYLSPRARESTFIPAFESDAERDAWINAHSMWRSHAHGANLWHVPNPMFTVLLSARPDAWVLTPDRRLREHVRRLAFAMVDTRGELADRESLDARLRGAGELFDAIRQGASLPPIDDAMHDLRAISMAIAAYAKANDGYLPGDLGEVFEYLDGLWGVHEREPARVFLLRDAETPDVLASPLDAQWVREHGSYVYLGDPTVRLRDLRGTQASILLHAPLDHPFDLGLPGDVGARVPFAGPLLGARSEPGDWMALPMFMFPPEVLKEQAEASRKAILEQAEK